MNLPFSYKSSIPNYLTYIRILIVPLIIGTFYIKSIALQKLISSILFLIACITDFFDGYLARKLSSHTKLGESLDPIADKILISSLFIMLIKYKEIDEIPCLIIVAREFLISGIRTNKIKLPSTFLAKIKTFLQMSTVFLFLISDNNSSNLNIYIYNFSSILLWISSLITLYTAVQYFLYYIKIINK